MPTSNPFQQQGSPTICPKCAGRGRRIRQFEGCFCTLAWLECLDCGHYQEEFNKQKQAVREFRRLW